MYMYIYVYMYMYTSIYISRPGIAAKETWYSCKRDLVPLTEYLLSKSFRIFRIIVEFDYARDFLLCGNVEKRPDSAEYPKNVLLRSNSDRGDKR